MKFGHVAALAKSNFFKTYSILLVEKGKKFFYDYLKKQDMSLVCWLTKNNLLKIDNLFKKNRLMTIAIIQARSSSKRFPNKVMMKINKEPLLNYVIRRVNKSKKIKKIIIACSNNKSDDAIANFCKKNNYIYFRGSLKNVLNRFVNVCKKFKLNHFVRVNGDSPCIDPKVMDRV